ncbi:MAG: hypothetical protein IAG13_20620 [Deltaproteobacteria bacterium]|nr:hypothetical protein [Nannocystaceae bacterium]
MLTCGFLVARHEAEVPHVRDRAGQVFHGVLASNPSGADADARIHARDSAVRDHRACPISASLHHPASIDHATISSPVAVVGLVVSDTSPQAGGSLLHVYRLAPKTSPPRT